MSEKRKIKNILVIRLRKIGDIVLTTPSLVAIKKLFPEATLDYLVEESYKELIINHPFVDKAIIVNKSDNIFKVRKKLNNYSIIYDMHGGPQASLITLLSKAKIKVGYINRYRSFVYDFKIPRRFENKIIHSVENQLNLVRSTGYDGNIPEKTILPEPTKQTKQKLDKILKKNNQNHDYAVIHIGAGNSFRDWGRENYRQLLEKLIFNSFTPVLIGGQDVFERSLEFESKFKNQLINLTNKLSLMGLKYVIQLSKVFFGVDSGPMHIASSTETPIVAIFGPNIPQISGPWRNKNVIIIQRTMDCRPCNQKKCIYGDIRCQKSIKPKEVLSKILEVKNAK